MPKYKYKYDHYEPEDAEELSDARFKWGPPEIVEELEELKRAGFNSHTKGFVDIDKQATPQCRRHRELMLELDLLIEDLLTIGKLIAFGFTKDTLAGPQNIPPTIWKLADANYNANTLEFEGQPESRITSIVVFEDPDKPEINKSALLEGTWSRSLEEAYKKRIDELVKAGDRSKREADVAFMKALFGDEIGHKRVYALRRKLAPADWQKKGRRKKKKPE